MQNFLSSMDNRGAEQLYYTPGAETPARKYFHKKSCKPARKTLHLLEKAARTDFCIEPLFCVWYTKHVV